MNHPLLYVANVLYLISYSVRDILWLRILSIIAMLCLGFCYVNCQEMVPFYWQLAFIGINGYQVVLLIRERRPVLLTEEERSLHEQALRTMSPRQVRRIVSQAQWREAQPGEQIVAENDDLERLILLQSGEAVVRTQGRDIATMRGGQFVGEMSFLTGGRTTAEVVAVDAVRYAEWPEQMLHEIGDREPDLAMALKSALGGDLVQKLLATRTMARPQPDLS